MNEAAPRPTQVTIAFAFQLGIAAALLLAAGLAVADAIHYNGLIDEAARAVATADPEEVAGERAGSWVGALFIGVPCLILAVWLGITAFGLRRGSNVARVLSAVGLGAPLALGLLFCCGGAFVGSLFGIVAASAFDDEGFDDGSFEDGDPSDLPGDPFYDKLDSLNSGTFSDLVGAIGGSVALLVLLLGVSTMILLFTGPARRYFRPQQALVPPPFYAYPPAYGYPSPYGYQPAYGYAYQPYAPPPAPPASWVAYPPPFSPPAFPAVPGQVSPAPPADAPPPPSPDNRPAG